MGGDGAVDPHFLCDVQADFFLLLGTEGHTARRKSTFDEGAPSACDN